MLLRCLGGRASGGPGGAPPNCCCSGWGCRPACAHRDEESPGRGQPGLQEADRLKLLLETEELKGQAELWVRWGFVWLPL